MEKYAPEMPEIRISNEMTGEQIVTYCKGSISELENEQKSKVNVLNGLFESQVRKYERIMQEREEKEEQFIQNQAMKNNFLGQQINGQKDNEKSLKTMSETEELKQKVSEQLCQHF